MDHVRCGRGTALGIATVLTVLVSLALAGQPAAAAGTPEPEAAPKAASATKLAKGAEQASKSGPAAVRAPRPAAARRVPRPAPSTASALGRNGFETHLRAVLVESTIRDHASSGLILTIERDLDITATDLTGISFTIDLPQYLYVASPDVDNDCDATFAPSYYDQQLVVTGAKLDAEDDKCTLGVSVTSPRSGSYTLNNAAVTQTYGEIGAQITTDTLVVTPRLPQLTGYFKSDEIDVGQTSTLTMRLYRSDQNPATVTSAIAWRVTLPSGIVVVSAGQNDCGGTVSAVATTRVFALTGGLIGAGETDCDAAVVVRGTAGDKYEIQNGALTKLHNVELTLGACTDSVSGNDVTVAQHSCAPRLKVVKLPQTVTFEQPEPRKVGKSALTASASSELAAGFTSSTTDVCTVSGTTLTVLTEGECKITAVQAGNGVYGSASSEERTIEILPRPPAPPTVEGTAGTSSITVTWTAPQETGAITDYVAAARSGDYVTSCVSTQMTCVLGAVAGRPYSLTVVSRGPNGVSKVTEGAETVTASAPEVPSAPPPTNLVLTTTDGKITTAEPGQEITFIGTGFARFSTVTITIYSEPVILGTAVTDGAGAFRKPITVPASLAAGAHSAVAQGVAPDGSPRAMALAITVAESLPQTGPALGAMLLAGFGAVLGGVVLMMAGRPRRRVLR